jgi:hypothetical protein
MKLDFDIKLGKFALFSILVIVILYGSYYSLFGIREGFEPGTCPKGCWGHKIKTDGNCKRYNVEDGYNTFYVKINPTATPISLVIPPGIYTGESLAAKMQTLILGIDNLATKRFTCKYLNQQIEFNLNNNNQSVETIVNIMFVLDPPFDKTPLESLFKTKKIVLKGNTPQFTELNLTNTFFPESLKPTFICPKACISGITIDTAYCQYDRDCSACDKVTCPKGVCPDPGTPPVLPPPSSYQSGGSDSDSTGTGSGTGSDGTDDSTGTGTGSGSGSGSGSGDSTDKPDCSKAVCYAQPLAGTNDKYPDTRMDKRNNEKNGFCGINYTAKGGMKFMFGCDSTEKCTKSNLDCNTVCKRDSNGKIIDTTKCKEYPCTKGVNWNKDECVIENPGDIESGFGTDSMDEYMSQLMKPGQMTTNRMYNFSKSRYGCDSSQYGCCSDGFTFRKDASGNNCFDFLPYYNPILFRGGA